MQKANEEFYHGWPDRQLLSHWSVLTTQKEGKPDIVNLPIQCNRKCTISPRKHPCKTTELESDHASRANYQFLRNTGIEKCIKFCLRNVISKIQNVGHSKGQDSVSFVIARKKKGGVTCWLRETYFRDTATKCSVCNTV